MSAAAANRLLQPEVLARLGTLDLVARTVVEGLLTGLHRSPDFGFSQEFAEYRAYNEGDDLRHVDWNVYARSDRMYVKRFRGETNTTATILLDASASMQFGSPVSKLDQGRFLAASLAYLIRQQHDALAMMVFADDVRDVLRPSSKPDSLMRSLSMLERTEASAGTDLPGTLTRLHGSLQKRGLVVLISDLYADADALRSALQPLAHGGHDLMVFHVLDPGETEPSLKTISALRDLETGEATVVDPEWLQTGYRDRFNAHCEALQTLCRAQGADYVPLSTADPLDSALHRYLQFRERLAR